MDDAECFTELTKRLLVDLEPHNTNRNSARSRPAQTCLVLPPMRRGTRILDLSHAHSLEHFVSKRTEFHRPVQLRKITMRRDKAEKPTIPQVGQAMGLVAPFERLSS